MKASKEAIASNQEKERIRQNFQELHSIAKF
jgi:hypothetical protein